MKRIVRAGIFSALVVAMAAATSGGPPGRTVDDRAAAPEAVVRGFLTEVRSGRNPDAATRYLAPQVIAHQVTSEGPMAIERTPAQYADHVRDFLATFGVFDFTIEEMLVAGPKVFVRWKQVGRHITSIAGEVPSQRPLVELTSVVYRVESGLIVEYWLQTDRKGLELQLEAVK